MYEKINTKTDQEKKRKLHRRKRSRKVLLVSLVVLFSVLLASGIIVSGMAIGFYESSVAEVIEVETANIYRLLGENSYILDREGEILERIEGEEQRIIVGIDEIPEAVQHAFIAIEDERFYFHNGLDYQRIVGAAGTTSEPGECREEAPLPSSWRKISFLPANRPWRGKFRMPIWP